MSYTLTDFFESPNISTDSRYDNTYRKEPFRLEYYTDEKDYIRNGVTLQFRDVNSKQVVYFEHNISDVVFQQCIFVGIEICRKYNKVHQSCYLKRDYGNKSDGATTEP